MKILGDVVGEDTFFTFQNIIKASLKELQQLTPKDLTLLKRVSDSDLLIINDLAAQNIELLKKVMQKVEDISVERSIDKMYVK